jgi:hypothetical protein
MIRTMRTCACKQEKCDYDLDYAAFNEQTSSACVAITM